MKYFLIGIALVLVVTTVPLPTLAQPQPVGHTPSKGIMMTNNETFEAAFRQYLQTLPEADKAAIPAEFRSYLLDTNAGAWQRTPTDAGFVLEKWHIVSDYSRVAVAVTATHSESGWQFGDLSYKQVHTTPASH